MLKSLCKHPYIFALSIYEGSFKIKMTLVNTFEYVSAIILPGRLQRFSCLDILLRVIVVTQKYQGCRYSNNDRILILKTVIRFYSYTNSMTNKLIIKLIYNLLIGLRD